jgi:hypothetical protein
MFRRFRSSLYFSLAIREYRNDNLSNSRLYIEKYLSSAKIKSATGLAFRATLILLDRDLNSARLGFLDAIRVIQKLSEYDSKYIELYCQYYICLIDEGVGCDKLRELALTIPASKRMKEWLSLPDVPVPS